MEAKIGHYNWIDLTVSDAESIRDFYKEIIGYSHTDIEMSGYKDYCLNSPSDDKTIAGICHRKSANSNLPPVWLVYFNVNNLNSSIDKVIRLGGKLISEIISYGPSGKYVIIQDPAGTFCALYQN